ncbi:restriction endonuclease subunit S [Micromonospora ureilytica]|uniref:restriction endonuclease subunit S n=1 Tax=Micromonospora ureilytica TaxID=709868 RepID=UPI002E15C656|nr:restriction endonuclease subunit S [Micromonospora ureilytica]
MSEELPSGWAEASLSDLIALDGIFVDGDWVESKDQDPQGEVRLVQLADVGDGVFRDRSDRSLTAEKSIQLRCTHLNTGDILVARMPEPLGRACIYPGSERSAVTVVDVCIIRPGAKSVDPRWLMWSLNAPSVREQIAAYQSGTTRKRISRKNLEKIQLRIPPLAEQRRIVEVIEDHLSRLDAADIYVASARKSTSSFDNARRMELLEPWLSSTRKLGTLLASPLINGRSVPTDDDGFPVLRLTAIRERVVDLSARKGGAWRKDDATPFLVNQGDFMVSRGSGSLHLVARGALVIDDPDPVAFPDTMIRVRPDLRTINPEYLAFVWDSPTVRRQIESLARTTAGIYKVNQSILESLDIPVPPLKVQGKIVEAAFDHFAGINRLASAMEKATRRSQNLRRAMLAEAFAGKLVTQDPSDEPALELLKRLKVEREIQPNATRSRRRLATTRPAPPRQTTYVSAGIQEELPL